MDALNQVCSNVGVGIRNQQRNHDTRVDINQ
jgi:hypothetical protein